MANVAPDFLLTPTVIDGCSNLLVGVVGERGRHTRSAVAIAELPFDIAVEIELMATDRPRSPDEHRDSASIATWSGPLTGQAHNEYDSGESFAGQHRAWTPSWE